MGRNNVAPTTPKPKVASSRSKTSKPDSEAELQIPATVPCDGANLIPWVEAAKLPKGYVQAVYLDRAMGRLCLVHNDRGVTYFNGLRDDFEPEVIKQGLLAAGAKAAERGLASRQGALEALVRTYCGYAAQKANRAVAPLQGSYDTYRGGPFRP